MTGNALSKQDLIGGWTHAHEEDDGDSVVFRPDSYAFAPSRTPRPGLQLAVDGTAAVLDPSADDRRVGTHGSWDLQGRKLTVQVKGAEKAYHVVSAAPDRLVLKPLPE